MERRWYVLLLQGVYSTINNEDICSRSRSDLKATLLVSFLTWVPRYASTSTRITLFRSLLLWYHKPRYTAQSHTNTALIVVPL